MYWSKRPRQWLCPLPSSMNAKCVNQTNCVAWWKFFGGCSGTVRQFSAIVKMLLLHMIVGVELLKRQIARVFLIFQAIPHKWVGAEANEFFVRCNGRFWRFTGGKSKNLQAADGGKGIAYAANELCGIALNHVSTNSGVEPVFLFQIAFKKL